MASVAQPALRGSRDWAYSVQKWNARRVISTSVLMPISSRFSQAIGWALTWSFYTAPPDFAKRNAFKHAFANKQWLDDFVGDLRGLFQYHFPSANRGQIIGYYWLLLRPNNSK